MSGQRPEQVHRVAEIFLDVMGLSENQAIYAAHSNTANYHVHIAANRVHPLTHKRIPAGGDWQVDMIHQAIAMIEHEQGWASEAKALYRANEHGVFHNETDIQVRDRGGITGRFPSKEQRAEGREKSAAEKDDLPIEEQLSDGARAYERRTQIASFERLAKTVVKPILHTARSWPDFHERLAEQGFEYEKGGTGARIRWGNQTLPATTADRSGALGQLEKRKDFGSFVARDRSVDVADRAPMPLKTGASVGKYEGERQAYALGVKSLKDHLQAHWAALEQNLDVIRECLSEDVNATISTGAGAMLNVARGVVGHEHQRLRAAVAEQFRSAAGALPTLQSFPSLEAWSAGSAAPTLPSPATVKMPAMLMSKGYGSAPLPVELPKFRRVTGNRAFLHVDTYGKIAVRDLGDLIIVDQSRNVEAVRGALLLAQKKWGSVSIESGDAAFRELCGRLAAEEGVRLINAAGYVEDIKPTIRYEHPQVGPIEYRAAISPHPAEPYRVATKTALPLIRGPEIEEFAFFDSFPFLRDPPVEQDRSSAKQFVGLNPLIDDWLVAHRKDAHNFILLRPMASRIMQNNDARAVVIEMEAEGYSEAVRITQQAQFEQHRQAGNPQATMQR